jgi:hypothetical protein
MKGLAREIKGFAHDLRCIVIERRTLEKRKDISHWASSRSPRGAGRSGGADVHLRGDECVRPPPRCNVDASPEGTHLARGLVAEGLSPQADPNNATAGSVTIQARTAAEINTAEPGTVARTCTLTPATGRSRVSVVKSQVEDYRAKAKEYARLTVVTKSLREGRRYRKLAEMYWALALGEESENVQPSK